MPSMLPETEPWPAQRRSAQHLKWVWWDEFQAIIDRFWPGRDTSVGVTEPWDEEEHCLGRLEGPGAQGAETMEDGQRDMTRGPLAYPKHEEVGLVMQAQKPKSVTFGTVVRLCFRCRGCWRRVVTQTLALLGVSDSLGSPTSGPSSWLPLVS